jgi:hypothetical protein
MGSSGPWSQVRHSDWLDYDGDTGRRDYRISDAGRNSSTESIAAIALALGWVSGGVIGGVFASIAGPLVASSLGWISSGHNRAWLMCWGIAGGITGAVGGSVILATHAATSSALTSS